MKLVMDERIKHRLVGLAVIVLISSIVMPTIMKQSTPPPLIAKTNVSGKTVAPTQEKEKKLFKPVTVAHVEIPSMNETLIATAAMTKKDSLNEIVAPITNMTNNIKAVGLATLQPTSAASVIKKDVKLAKDNNDMVKTSTANTKKAITDVATAGVSAKYMVQLGTFAQQRNAELLVKKLRKKGYTATYNKSTSKKGIIFKVMVGGANHMQDAVVLQQQLASTLQMKGLIVTTRIS